MHGYKRTGLGGSNTAGRGGLGGRGERGGGLSSGGEEGSVGAGVAQGTAALASETRGTASDEDHFEEYVEDGFGEERRGKCKVVLNCTVRR
jgi:hypothetical protein